MSPYLLSHLLDLSAEKYPRRPAVIQGERTLDYADLAGLAGRLAAALVDLGVRPGDRVGLLTGKSLEGVAAIYGVLRAGGIYVPLDPQAPPQRQGKILDRCAVAVMIADARLAAPILADREARAGVRAVILIGEGADVQSGVRLLPLAALEHYPPAAPARISDARPAYILHTSGSTGVPKGVTISHRNALAFVGMAADFFAIGREDRLASHAPFHFDLSIFDLFVAAQAGAAVVLVPENLGIFPARLAQFIDKSGITVWNSVASVVSLLAERGNLDACHLDALRLVLFSGDILPVRQLRRVREAMPGAELYNLYGQTEANSSTFFRVGEIPADPCWKIPIGKPFPNFEVFALDETGQPIRRPGEIGELHVYGATVALGYWRDDEKTAAAFVEHPLHPWPGKVYRTGDLVALDDAGNLLFLGRRDRQVKSRGYRIQIDEIEHALNNHPAVEKGAAVDIPDDLLGCRIIAFVRLAAGGDDTDLLDFCSRSLPPYMLPERIITLNEFPCTATGKIDRNALRAMRGRTEPAEAVG
ncbi:MAG: amino acid adenylation domain-containing protein [Desulfuromonadales bacterium]